MAVVGSVTQDKISFVFPSILHWSPFQLIPTDGSTCGRGNNAFSEGIHMNPADSHSHKHGWHYTSKSSLGRTSHKLRLSRETFHCNICVSGESCSFGSCHRTWIHRGPGPSMLAGFESLSYFCFRYRACLSPLNRPVDVLESISQHDLKVLQLLRPFKSRPKLIPPKGPGGKSLCMSKC
jgi:hypothetical protein